jgi:hypothetical protein
LPAILSFLDLAAALTEELSVHFTRVVVPIHEQDDEGAIEPMMRKLRCGSHFRASRVSDVPSYATATRKGPMLAAPEGVFKSEPADNRNPHGSGFASGVHRTT